MSSPFANAYDELHWRGSIYDMTAGPPMPCETKKLPATTASIPRRPVCISAVWSPILGLVRLQRHGHTLSRWSAVAPA